MSHPPIWPQISRCQTDHPLLGLGDTTSQYRLPWPSGKQNVKILRRFVRLRLCPLGKQSLINYDLDKKLACLKIHGEIPESYIFWIHDWVISAYDVGVDDSDHNDALIAQMADIGFKVVLLERLNQKWKQKHF